jgi:CRISPR-associated endonuclease/helicase Cas3
MKTDFDRDFSTLTGAAPFPWQQRLYRSLVAGQIPSTCALPTGLGKTSVIAVWLLARAVTPSLPRRLVYVVNRRTVVDQTTFEVERLRSNREAARIGDFAVSTLRGQMADNREWSEDPSRPAVISGTVDMIGSRLLFSGYRIGYKTRPLHAGFLGQDSLVVHDEAHLEPAFQKLLERIADEQRRGKDLRPMRVMALSATTRDLGASGTALSLEADDLANPIVAQRIHAPKRLHLHPCDDKELVSAVVARVASFEHSGRAILVFLRTVDAVNRVLTLLPRGLRERALPLTGTMRGLERDRMVDDHSVFARFLPPTNRRCSAIDGTAVLVCTSAGEVGVNLSADHLVSDLAPFDSMAQRFGRVNRFGTSADSEVHVLHPTRGALKAEVESAKSPWNEVATRRLRTLALLERLGGDVSPARLTNLPSPDRIAAFTPEPTITPCSEILFDAWTMTTVRGRLPGRPAVEEFLHGVAGWEPPTTQVVWRDEVDVIGEALWSEYPPEDLLEDYPIKPHEILTDRTTRVVDSLLGAARDTAHHDMPLWVIDSGGTVALRTLGQLLSESRKSLERELAGSTIALSPKGCRPVEGLLSDASWSMPDEASAAGDVADEWFGENEDGDGGHPRRRQRGIGRTRPPGMRLVRTLRLSAEVDGAGEDARVWRWYEMPHGADGDGPREAKAPVTLAVHSHDVRGWAEKFVRSLDLPAHLAKAVVVAAWLHDIGKARKVWQRSIGNRRHDLVLAKGGGPLEPRNLTRYRHELGSVFDAQGLDDWCTMGEDERELVLHLVAAHHGRARPHFPTDELFDPESPAVDVAAAGIQIMRRFSTLQRKYGRWGLAYLESLVRAADYAASAEPSAVVEVEP